MAKSVDCALAKPSPAKRRQVQTLTKAYHKEWPFTNVDKKGDTCVNSEIHSTFV